MSGLALDPCPRLWRPSCKQWDDGRFDQQCFSIGAVCSCYQFLRQCKPCRADDLSNADQVCAHAGGLGDGPADAGGCAGYAGRAFDGYRPVCCDGLVERNIAHLSCYSYRNAFGCADADADEQRRRGTEFNFHKCERAISELEHLRWPTSRACFVQHPRDFCAHAARQLVGNALCLRRKTHANSDSDGNRGGPAALSIVPTSMSFSAQQAGVPSAPQTVTISNSGAVSMANIGFQFTGPAATSYSITGTNCGGTLNAGANCTAQVVFTPAATGVVAATLVVSSSTVGVNPASVVLNGSGQVGGGISSAPAQVSFGVVGVGQASTRQTLTITNGSGYAVSAVTLSVDAPFVLAQNNCTAVLSAGANCTAAVAFQPTLSGPAVGLLTISSPDFATAASVALSGTGFDFAVGFSGTGTLTVASGRQRITP
jgi:hypothetical protein